MPRGPRLDAPGVLHHVMVRGMERRAIFRDDPDRREFVARLGALTQTAKGVRYVSTVVQVEEQPDGGASPRGRNQFPASYPGSQGGDHG